MGKYRKTVEVLAFQWTGGPDQKEDPVWFIEEIMKSGKWDVWFFPESPAFPAAMLLESDDSLFRVNAGSFIVREAKNRLEVYTTEDFNNLFSLVQDGDGDFP